VREVANDAELCQTFRQVLRLLTICHQYAIFVHDLDEVERILAQRPELRRAMFWTGLRRRAQGELLDTFFQVFHG
jgi:hypothetical protein